MSDRRKTLILGIGNTLLQDEGAGVHAIRMLPEQVAQRDDIKLMLPANAASIPLDKVVEKAAGAWLNNYHNYPLLWLGAECFCKIDLEEARIFAVQL